MDMNNHHPDGLDGPDVPAGVPVPMIDVDTLLMSTQIETLHVPKQTDLHLPGHVATEQTEAVTIIATGANVVADGMGVPVMALRIAIDPGRDDALQVAEAFRDAATTIAAQAMTLIDQHRRENS